MCTRTLYDKGMDYVYYISTLMSTLCLVCLRLSLSLFMSPFLLPSVSLSLSLFLSLSLSVSVSVSLSLSLSLCLSLSFCQCCLNFSLLFPPPHFQTLLNLCQVQLVRPVRAKLWTRGLVQKQGAHKRTCTYYFV